jgi:hypothetical protein
MYPSSIVASGGERVYRVNSLQHEETPSRGRAHRRLLSELSTRFTSWRLGDSRASWTDLRVLGVRVAVNAEVAMFEMKPHVST